MKNYEIRAYNGSESYDYVKLQAENVRSAAEQSGFSDCKVAVLGIDGDCATFKLGKNGKITYEYKPQI